MSRRPDWATLPGDVRLVNRAHIYSESSCAAAIPATRCHTSADGFVTFPVVPGHYWFQCGNEATRGSRYCWCHGAPRVGHPRRDVSGRTVIAVARAAAVLREVTNP